MADPRQVLSEAEVVLGSACLLGEQRAGVTAAALCRAGVPLVSSDDLEAAP